MKKNTLQKILVLFVLLMSLTGCSVQDPTGNIYATHLQRYKVKAYTEFSNQFEVGYLEDSEIYFGGARAEVDYFFIDGKLIPFIASRERTPQEEMDHVWNETEHGEYYQAAFAKYWEENWN